METLTLPHWLAQTVHFFGRNWEGILGIIAIALVSSIIVEVLKHKGSWTQEEAKCKAVVRWGLLIISAGFTALGYVIFFLQSNESALKQLPQIGQAEVEVLGAAWTLYNFRLNKTYKNVASKLASWSKSTTPVTGTPIQNLQSPVAPATDVAEASDLA